MLYDGDIKEKLFLNTQNIFFYSSLSEIGFLYKALKQLSRKTNLYSRMDFKWLFMIMLARRRNT